MTRAPAGLGRRRTSVPGLFLAGAGIHPGGELSGAPGYNAARTVAVWLADRGTS